MKLPKNFAGILLGLLVVLVFMSRGVPRAVLAENPFAIFGPAVGFAVVVALVIALTLDRSGRKKVEPRSQRHQRR